MYSLLNDLITYFMVRNASWSMSVFDFFLFCAHCFLIKKITVKQKKMNDISHGVTMTYERHFVKFN